MKVAPLSGTFMLISIIGFILASLYIYKYSASFGFAMAILFVFMFIASMISLTKAPINAQMALDAKSFQKRPKEVVRKRSIRK